MNDQDSNSSGFRASSPFRASAPSNEIDSENMFCAQQSIGSPFNPSKPLTDLSPLDRTFVPKT